MIKEKSIGFIGGGNMGTALIKGVLTSGLYKPKQVLVSDASEARLAALKDKYHVRTFTDNVLICQTADAIVLAVKPQQFTEVLTAIGDKVSARQTVISIAAGIRLSYLQRSFRAKVPLIRVMPNTPALVGKGMAVLCTGKYALRRHADLAMKLFCSVGKALTMPEDYLDAVTAVSGSGPAYVFYLLEALQDAGTRAGLPKEKALFLAEQTVWGAAALALESGGDPALLRTQVTSKGGTTEAALTVFDQAGLKETIIRGVLAAVQRSRDLGKG